MKRYLILICLLINACSTLPPAIKTPPIFDISYTQALQKITNYTDAPVRWGGVIIDVENEQNFSLVQVLSYPLSDDGEPQTDQQNEGRFLIKSSEFLDPAVYKKDTKITVAGKLIGDIERTIGKKVVRLPMVSGSTIYQWPVYQYNNYYDGYGYGYGYNPYYGYGGYPYYRGYYSSPFMHSPFRHR
jgi:outer membrane lipoprotein